MQFVCRELFLEYQLLTSRDDASAQFKDASWCSETDKAPHEVIANSMSLYQVSSYIKRSAKLAVSNPHCRQNL